MTHKPIHIKNLCLSLPHKVCFEDFTTDILQGSRIAIIGRNGSGKSMLLKILQGIITPSSGEVMMQKDVCNAYVPQIIEEFDNLSGGQRFNAALTKAIARHPNVLFLDEPTNHLDGDNRKSLLRMLQQYAGTLLVVTHDEEILYSVVDTLWHVDNGKIHVFNGNYKDYQRERESQRNTLEQQINGLQKQKKHMHNALMKEQKRAANSKSKGEKSIKQKKWPTVVSTAKASRAELTSGRKKAALKHDKQKLVEELSCLSLPEVIVPTFSISSTDILKKTIISIKNGSLAYEKGRTLLDNIHININSKDRICIQGANGSGKTTLIRALLGHENIIKSGEWNIPREKDIGYLDQHYHSLMPGETVLNTIAHFLQDASQEELRRHLNGFLFRKNEEVNAYVENLSGGEKVRLSLAIIAANTPKLLILDEITNNLDIETKNHVTEVLRDYPGAMIVISHDKAFLKAIKIEEYYEISHTIGTLNRVSKA